jgi:prepilin peptidase CpaA
VLELLCLCVFPGAMALAGSMDLVTMTIPNRISIFLVGAFAVLAPFVGLTAVQLAQHLGSGAAMLAIGVFMFSRGWIGGGDAKIFATVALWFGFDYLGDFAMLSAIAGGVLTVTLLAFRRLPLPAFVKSQAWLVRLHHPRTGVPYGIAMAAAALMVYPSTPWFMSVIG